LAVTLSLAVTTIAVADPVTVPNKLDHLLVIEAESCVDAAGTPIIAGEGAKATLSTNVFYHANEQASGGGIITPVAAPFHLLTPFAEPVEARTEVNIPLAGRWYGHVRYAVAPEKLENAESRKSAPFQVVVGGKRFTVGANQSAGEEFRWDHFAVDLPAGRTPVKFLMPDMAGPDCLVFSPATGYAPEVSDYEGPLWLRFKVVKGAETPFFIRATCRLGEYLKIAGWLFKDTVAGSEEEAAGLRKDAPRLLKAGEWSPWVRTFTRKILTGRILSAAEIRDYPYYVEVVAMTTAGPGSEGLDQIEMRFQAATRPDEAFVVRESAEFNGTARDVLIRMPYPRPPAERGLDTLRRGVRSFSEWADDRLKLVTDLGLKAGEGPRRIQIMTMNQLLRTHREVDVFLETSRLLGFNGIDLTIYGSMKYDQKALWDRAARDGFTWTGIHHLAAYWDIRYWLGLPVTPLAGQTMQQAVDAYWYDLALKHIHEFCDGLPEQHRRILDLAILVDEPGPVVNFIWQGIPAVKLCYHEFLRANNVTPDLFGKKTWDEVDMIGYWYEKKPGWVDGLKQLNIDLEFVEPTGPVPAADLIHTHKVAGTNGAADRYRVQIPILKRGPADVADPLRVAGPEEKRQYYWTQRFRSYFTRHFYGQTARAVADLAKQGYFNSGIKTTPNFQAEPMSGAKMWDGALDLFEWARDNTTNSLMIEDWMPDSYGVGFGMSLLNSASRKRGQSLAHLIVATENYRRRYLTSLGIGTQTYLDYLYGSYGVIGPAWMDRPEMVRDRADMLRWTRRVEDDLLATRLRPADTAFLVANSSEINSAYYNASAAEGGMKRYNFGWHPFNRRLGLYAGLLDAGVPTEIVSETAILEDQELNRYKALYVTDTHVSSAVQGAIKAWVRNGGTLWADYTALARNEYDQNSSTMNEVFGLSSRGPLPGPAGSAEEPTAAAAATPPPLGKIEAAAMKIHVAASSDRPALQEVTFDGSLFSPEWKLSTGKALATFSNGSPAVVLNRYGKGQAILVGCSAPMFSPYAKQSTDNPDFLKALRVMTLGSDLAGAAKACRASVPRIASFVRDGPSQTVLVLVNSTDAAQAKVQVSLTVPHKVIKAFDARGKVVVFTQTGHEVKFTRTFAADDGDIIVFKW